MQPNLEAKRSDGLEAKRSGLEAKRSVLFEAKRNEECLREAKRSEEKYELFHLKTPKNHPFERFCLVSFAQLDPRRL
ncbi:hypothetical protein Tco_0991100 [Tanacetum coccineum]|uniref:Uncharacterized protein n=1 Tax=Tanacetum coccineum TaxID=301880 RepID=A0ABQ5EYA7_9ASTR